MCVKSPLREDPEEESFEIELVVVVTHSCDARSELKGHGTSI